MCLIVLVGNIDFLSIINVEYVVRKKIVSFVKLFSIFVDCGVMNL